MLLATTLVLAWAAVAGGQNVRPDASAQRSALGYWGDQGDNTYLNPVLPGDFSDLDAIRLGKDFYAISSTMQYAPGVAVLHSRDLVNWRIVGHVVSDLAKMDPELGWQRMNRAGRGIWAGAIRYHAGHFWVYFGTPDSGIYVSTADRANGPWSAPKLVLAEEGWDDPCPFWDDDGRGYLITTRFAADRDGVKYRIHLFAMTPGSDGVVASTDRVVHQSEGSEANKLYKIGGMYLHYFSEVRPEGRVAMMERSKRLEGPWEVRQLNHVDAATDKEPNQGGLMQLEDGHWWFLTHQGTGDWEGRAAVLLPVTWVDGWPVLGKPGADGIGQMVWGGVKPIRSEPGEGVFVSDDFRGKALRPEWEWRYQPRADKWSLTGEGVRLWGFAPLQGRGFDGVGNVLTQRAARSQTAEVAVQMKLNGMVDGQEAGLAHFAKTDARVAVVQRDGTRRVIRMDGERQTEGLVVTGDTVWFRSTWNVQGKATFAYSTDGTKFVELGGPYQLTWGSYRGDRVGLYTVNRSPGTGFVDFQQFVYRVER